MKKPKEYTNGRITVQFELDKCIHSENCWRGLSAVFDPKQRPWVNMDGAGDDEIIKQVNKCPSGALSIKGETTMSDNKIQAECMPNGPLIVKGNIEVKKADGSMEIKEKMAAFCRCGQSSNKPYCDGAHKEAGFQG